MTPPTTKTRPATSSKGRKLELLLSISISAAKSSGSLLAGATSCELSSSVTLGSITVGIPQPPIGELLPPHDAATMSAHQPGFTATWAYPTLHTGQPSTPLV